MPGATVAVKNLRTTVTLTAVTNSAGAFDVPALDAGVYSITVSLNGFKTAVMTDVELLSGTTRSVKVTLEVGALTRVRRSPRRQPARPDAGDDGLVDDTRRPDFDACRSSRAMR